MEGALVKQVDTAEIEPVVTSLMGRAPSYPAISSPAEANEVSAYMLEIVEIRKKIAKFFRPTIDAAHNLHKNLLAQMKRFDAGPAEVEANCRELLKDWATEQERLRKIEQNRLDKEAREKAARKAREAAELAKGQGDKRAAKMAEKEAKKIESGKVGVFSSIAATKEPVAGVTTVKVYKAELTDMALLLKAIVQGKAPQNLVTFAQSEANRLARSTKGSMAIPGVRWIEDSTIRKTPY